MYTWDPRDPVSLMFAYPVNPGRDVSASYFSAQSLLIYWMIALVP